MKKLKISLSFALVCAFACTLWAQAPAGSPVALHGRLSVSGNKIVDEHGEPFQMRGMSFFWNSSGWGGDVFYNAGAVNELADNWKVSVVRAAVARSTINQSTGEINHAGTNTVIEQAIAKGIYVVIDFHSHNYLEKSIAQTFFKTMSNKYKNTPNVIYEILNEPCPVGGYGTSSESTCNGDDWNTQIRPYAVDVVKTIRDNGDQNIIVIGSADYSKMVNEVAANPVSGTNLAYSVHYYAASEGTMHTSDLRAICQVAVDAGVALLVTEFDISESSGSGPINTVEGDKWFRGSNVSEFYLDKYSIGWMKWSVYKAGQTSGALSGGASNDGSNWSSNLSTTGTYIKNKLSLYATTPKSTLTLSTIGEGSILRVKSRGDTVAIGNTSEWSYGTHVELVAKAAEGWEFSGWEGGGSGRLIVDMYGNRSATARFVQGGNLIKNGNFLTNDEANWTVSNNVYQDPSPDGKIVTPVTNNELKLAFGGNRTGVILEHSYLYQNNIEFKTGRRYRLSFDARGEQAREIDVTVCNNSPRTTRYLNAYTVCLNTQNKTAGVEFDIVTQNGADVSNGRVEFWFGGTDVSWYITNVSLFDIGPSTGEPASPAAPAQCGLAVSQGAPAAKAAWGVVHGSGGLQLRGPVGKDGAKVSLYDVRGRLVKRVSLKSGGTLTLNKTVAPAGNYLVVVKNGSGRDVYKTRVSLVN